MKRGEGRSCTKLRGSIRDLSAMYPRCIRDVSAMYPRHIRDTSTTHPRHIRDTSATDASVGESRAGNNRRLVRSFAEERPKSAGLHRKPSSAWRKERRRDPIQSEALDMSAARVHNHHSRPSVIVPTTAAPQPGPRSPESSGECLTGRPPPAHAQPRCPSRDP
jgi:hypothetical protein